MIFYTNKITLWEFLFTRIKHHVVGNHVKRIHVKRGTAVCIAYYIYHKNSSMKIHTYFSFHSMKTCDEKNFDDENFNYTFMSNRSRVGYAPTLGMLHFFLIATATFPKKSNPYCNRYFLQKKSSLPLIFFISSLLSRYFSYNFKIGIWYN